MVETHQIWYNNFTTNKTIFSTSACLMCVNRHLLIAVDLLCFYYCETKSESIFCYNTEGQKGCSPKKR